MIESAPIRLLKRDVAVWLVNAGKERKFLEEFISSRRIFLETPGFVGASGIFSNDTLVRRHLARSWAINEQIRGASGAAPSRNLANYTASPFASGTPEARAFSELAGNVVRLFKEAKVGDVVMIPRYGTFAPFLVGEITSPWSDADSRPITQLGGELVATRKVRWLETAVARSDFSARIGKRLVNRHAVTEVPKSFYQAIFNRIYPNYSWGNLSKLDIFGNDYSGKDPTQPYRAALLVKYVLSSVFAYERGEIVNFNNLSRTSSIEAAIAAYYDESLVDELAQNFNSPGRFTFVGRVGLVSILAASALMLATAEDGLSFTAQKAQVSQQVQGNLVGSTSAKGEANIEIDNFLNAAEGSVWQPVQQNLGQPAKRELGISLNNDVELARKKAELEE